MGTRTTCLDPVPYVVAVSPCFVRSTACHSRAPPHQPPDTHLRSLGEESGGGDPSTCRVRTDIGAQKVTRPAAYKSSPPPTTPLGTFNVGGLYPSGAFTLTRPVNMSLLRGLPRRHWNGTRPLPPARVARRCTSPTSRRDPHKGPLRLR